MFCCTMADIIYTIFFCSISEGKNVRCPYFSSISFVPAFPEQNWAKHLHKVGFSVGYRLQLLEECWSMCHHRQLDRGRSSFSDRQSNYTAAEVPHSWHTNLIQLYLSPTWTKASVAAPKKKKDIHPSSQAPAVIPLRLLLFLFAITNTHPILSRFCL